MAQCSERTVFRVCQISEEENRTVKKDVSKNAKKLDAADDACIWQLAIWHFELSQRDLVKLFNDTRNNTVTR